MVWKPLWCPSSAAPAFGTLMSMNTDGVCRLNVLSPSCHLIRDKLVHGHMYTHAQAEMTP